MERTHEELNKLKPYGKLCRKLVLLTFRYDEVSLHLLTLHFASISLRSPWIEAQYGARFRSRFGARGSPCPEPKLRTFKGPFFGSNIRLRLVGFLLDCRKVVGESQRAFQQPNMVPAGTQAPAHSF